jgi:hypothetical protein
MELFPANSITAWAIKEHFNDAGKSLQKTNFSHCYYPN